MEVVLAAENIAYQYDAEHKVFEQVSFSLKEGELLTLLGPNGVGKSTLLNCLAGFISPTAGRVLLAGKDIKTLSPRQMASQLAYITQDNQNRCQYTVKEYILLGCAPRLGLFEQPGSSEIALVESVMKELGIETYADQSCDRISGGQRQMAAIARAIVQQTRIILLDEPMSALDLKNQIAIMKVLKKLLQKGYAIVITTHNPEQPILLQGMAAFLTDKNLIVGKVDDIITEKKLREVYQADLRLLYIEDVNRKICVIDKI